MAQDQRTPAGAGPAPYILGHGPHEHDRLARQAEHLRPVTARLLGDAGVSPGRRLLDLGSGLGDVALLAGPLVGPTGTVVGVERDPGAREQAADRARQAGFGWVRFVDGDVADLRGSFPDGSVDAVVGRCIVSHLADRLSDVLRGVRDVLRPGGSWRSLNRT